MRHLAWTLYISCSGLTSVLIESRVILCVLEEHVVRELKPDVDWLAERLELVFNFVGMEN